MRIRLSRGQLRLTTLTILSLAVVMLVYASVSGGVRVPGYEIRVTQKSATTNTHTADASRAEGGAHKQKVVNTHNINGEVNGMSGDFGKSIDELKKGHQEEVEAKAKELEEQYLNRGEAQAVGGLETEEEEPSHTEIILPLNSATPFVMKAPSLMHSSPGSNPDPNIQIAFDYPALRQQDERANATFVSLVRNKELKQMIRTVKNYEDRFNHKFRYDWVFLNDEPFDDTFVDAMTNLVSGTAKFGVVPKEHWSVPSWVDQDKADKARKAMAEQVIYGDSESYRHMCRFNSGFFFHHKLMQDYRYYWRVEPETAIHCDVNYDIFQFMQTNNKTYGFTITLLEYPLTVASLWQETKAYTQANPHVLAKDNLLNWLSYDKGENYNMCHFWSNFEVADMDFWRSETYQKYFEHLDKSGGFFYERWGDAPVHSIAAALFLPKSEVHFFNDIGYTHPPFTHCPIDGDTRKEGKCSCLAEETFDWKPCSCLGRYLDVQRIKRPHDWEQYSDW